VPGLLLSHNVDRIEIPRRVRTELQALGIPLRNAGGAPVAYGLVDYIAVQQWGGGNEAYREFIDLQVQFVNDDPRNRLQHYQVGFHTVQHRDLEGSVGCHYVDSEPDEDGLRMHDVWAGTHAASARWGAACGRREPSANQKRRENYDVPLNAVQLLSTVATQDDTVRIYYGQIRPEEAETASGNSQRARRSGAAGAPRAR